MPSMLAGLGRGRDGRRERPKEIGADMAASSKSQRVGTSKSGMGARKTCGALPLFRQLPKIKGSCAFALEATRNKPKQPGIWMVPLFWDESSSGFRVQIWE